MTAPVGATTDDRSASQILVWSRTVLAPAMRAAIDSLPPSTRHIAGYHMGWWDSKGTPGDADGGKAIRPALALLSAQAVGGAAEDAVPAAVAVELVHNFSLLHDDVIDGDETRRHRTTAWRVFGVGNAILAGDALLTLAFDVLAASGASFTISRTIGVAVQALIDGQHSDLAFESRRDVDLNECVRMAEHKTGALLRCACTLGALAGGGTREQVAHIGHFGGRIGLAFQVVDDLQGIWGDPVATGKPAHSDLRNRKKSLPVVAALVSGTPASKKLAAWFDRETDSTAPDLEAVAALVGEAGGRTWSQAYIEGLRAEGLQHLWSARPVARAAAELEVLALLVASRQPVDRGEATTAASSGP